MNKFFFSVCMFYCSFAILKSNLSLIHLFLFIFHFISFRIGELENAKPRKMDLSRYRGAAAAESSENGIGEKPPYKNPHHTQKAFEVMNILRK